MHANERMQHAKITCADMQEEVKVKFFWNILSCTDFLTHANIELANPNKRVRDYTANVRPIIETMREETTILFS